MKKRYKVVLLLLVIFLSAEILLRVTMIKNTWGEGTFQEASKLSFVMKPNWSGNLCSSDFCTKIKLNSYGLRDDEQSLINPDIIFIGDSFQFGYGLNEDELYSSMIENITKLKALNAGVQAYGTINEYYMLFNLSKNGILNNKTKYIILQMYVNDVLDNNYYFAHGGSSVVKVNVMNILQKLATDNIYIAQYIERNFPQSNFWLYLKRSLGVNDVYPPEFNLHKKDYDNETEKGVNLTLDYIIKIKNISGDKKFIIVLIPSRNTIISERWLYFKNVYKINKTDYDIEKFGKLLNNFTMSNNITFVDMTSIFAGYWDSKQLYFKIDGHITKLGASLITDKIVTIIQLS